MNRILKEPDAQVECWFRKDPTTFSELVTQQNPENFWIHKPGIPAGELGEDARAVFVNSYFSLWDREWTVNNTQRRLGHADMLVVKGSRRVGAVLVNNTKTPVSQSWYSRLVVLGPQLSLLPLGRIE